MVHYCRKKCTDNDCEDCLAGAHFMSRRITKSLMIGETRCFCKQGYINRSCGQLNRAILPSFPAFPSFYLPRLFDDEEEEERFSGRGQEDEEDEEVEESDFSSSEKLSIVLNKLQKIRQMD
ncbi:Oidioi.mRNA.OKI2018_I69.chr1.g1304.t1.cds [Oikopleura dioica]|uniref:Oidioi.mRNA.OKI2018_I69.chr1.g1304.t1.cds n=1 Tax=Oikopleura dioica TaxID=34765 RepID=A0ABN7SSI7_OIKDI|nr:Oidioi.mRNA.OKI2018_I69.chr1.g1304.t1.cds [Oikopleura dioica]